MEFDNCVPLKRYGIHVGVACLGASDGMGRLPMQALVPVIGRATKDIPIELHRLEGSRL